MKETERREVEMPKEKKTINESGGGEKESRRLERKGQEESREGEPCDKV